MDQYRNPNEGPESRNRYSQEPYVHSQGEPGQPVSGRSEKAKPEPFKWFVNAVEVLALFALAVFVVNLFRGAPAIEIVVAPPAAEGAQTGDAAGGADAAPSVDPVLLLGQGVYDARCASCHGGDRGGGVGPALTATRLLERFPDPSDQAAVVRDGRGGMPSFGGSLEPGQIDAVVTFTRS